MPAIIIHTQLMHPPFVINDVTHLLAGFLLLSNFYLRITLFREFPSQIVVQPEFGYEAVLTGWVSIFRIAESL